MCAEPRASHVVEDQSEAIAFLAAPESHGGAAVERIDTHGAVVVLAGARAYKLKRAVKFPYMDYSTLALRRRACEAELALNRRTAPELYLAALPITRAPDGGLALGGGGPAVDWVVVMRRFAEGALFERMAERGALAAPLMTALADAVLALHRAAEVRPEHGGSAGIARVIRGNDRELAEAREAGIDAREVLHLGQASEAALQRLAPLLEARRLSGLVRHCHGDLHLRNICLWGGRPTLFDAIEFNDEISCVDVLYDLAFLLMDLDKRGLGPLGNRVFNRYLSEGARDAALGDLGGLAALPLFLSCRAAVRAQVGAAAAAAQRDAQAERRAVAEAGSYLRLALGYLAPPPAVLVAVGGLSGSGKSTLAEALAPSLGAVPGALVLRSDVIRKHLLGCDPLARLGPEGYTPEMTARVYAAMRSRARTALAAGHAVIADAVHARPSERAALEAVAREAGARFRGLWLEAPSRVLGCRVERREGDASDASDATAAVLHAQLALELGALGWHKLDAAGPPAETLAAARTVLGLSADGRH